MASQPKHRQFKPRRWPLFAFMAMVAAIVVTLVAVTRPPTNDLQAKSDRPETSSTTAPVVPQAIGPSRATQVFIPADDPDLVINNGVSDLASCMPEIEPPLDGSRIGAIYECMDFALPSSSSPSLSILAGHSSCRVDTVFNRLNQQKQSLINREVSIKTEASGDKWLVYRIEATYEPTKAELPYVDKIWGSAEVPTAGRLVLVTCLLNADCSRSTHNFIAVAQFVGTR